MCESAWCNDVTHVVRPPGDPLPPSPCDWDDRNWCDGCGQYREDVWEDCAYQWWCEDCLDSGVARDAGAVWESWDDRTGEQ